MDKQYDFLPQKVKSEITREMWEGLLKLKKRLKGNKWKNLRCVHERTTTECVVIEAVSPAPSSHKHWFQVGKNGEITPCITYMGCK